MKKTRKSFEWNKVTPLSKAIAMIMFIALPFIGFVLGMKYQKMLTEIEFENARVESMLNR
jgi:hypothetical protein